MMMMMMVMLMMMVADKMRQKYELWKKGRRLVLRVVKAVPANWKHHRTGRGYQVPSFPTFKLFGHFGKVAFFYRTQVRSQSTLVTN